MDEGETNSLDQDEAEAACQHSGHQSDMTVALLEIEKSSWRECYAEQARKVLQKRLVSLGVEPLLGRLGIQRMYSHCAPYTHVDKPRHACILLSIYMYVYM